MTTAALAALSTLERWGWTVLRSAAFAACAIPACAQIGNGGFEQHSDCPTELGQIDRAIGWYSPSMGTPDYFHTCGSSTVGVPQNFFGSQSAHAGDAYCGLLIKNSGTPALEWREYVQAPLAAPLAVGVNYQLDLYVSLAEYSQFGSSAIAALLSTGPVARADNGRFTQIPQAMNAPANLITDKDGWVLITISFTADSAYSFITIGNFLNDAQTPVVAVDGGTEPRTYFFLDDLSIQLSPIQGDVSICAGDSTVLTALNTTSPAWALATDPATIISTAPAITVSPGTTTTYLLFNGTDTASITVNVHPLPILNLGNDTTLCDGEVLTLYAASPGGTYLWQDQSTAATFLVSAPGAYTVQVTSSGCSSRDTLLVAYEPSPQVDLGEDFTLCPGDSALLDASTLNGNYSWQDGSSTSAISVHEAGIYWVTVSVGQCATTDSLVVGAIPSPVIDTTGLAVLCRGGTLTLDATVTGASYLWQDGSTGPLFIVRHAGLYSVFVSLGGCTVSQSVFITEETCAATVEMPNVVTPDHNGTNDLFIPVLLRGISTMRTVVLDRWGNTVFETNDPQVRWDAANVSGGVYFWAAAYTDVDGRPGNASGCVTVLK